ncbi:MAG: ATP-binding response regulator [Anaerolineae bacterium]
MYQPNSQRVHEIALLNESDLRSGAAQAAAALLAIACQCLWWWLLAQQHPDWRLVALASVLVPLFIVAHYTSRNRPRTGPTMVALAVVAGALMLAHLSPGGAFGAVYALPGIVLAAVYGPWAALWLGVPVAIALAAITGAGTTGFFLAELLLANLCVYAVLVPKERVLAWSWQRSADATYLAGQLQDRQGELNRALAALRLAYQLLERTNRELALARQEAEEARRLKEQFVANVSHELRTPLNIVLGFAEVMHRTPEVYGLPTWPQDLRLDIAEVWHSAQYISELVDDILELARLDALQMPVTREFTQLGDLIRETCALAGRLLRDKPTVLDVDVPDGLPAVPVDRTRIRQVLVNLLTNAIRFTDCGRIAVTAQRRGEDIVVSVADTGIGIPPHEVEIVFDEFRQVDGRPERGGKGLGLAIAKRFVQLHGGRIWAESEEGVGSTFYFSLPLHEKSVSRLRGTLGMPHGPTEAPKLVVLRDDEAAEAPAYLARHLEGYQVLTAERQADLQALVAGEHPAAVVVSRSVGDCASWAAAVADSLPAGVPVIGLPLSTPHLEPDSDLFDAVLSKPVTREALLGAIGRLAAGQSVLVVDDDRGFVQLVRRLLSLPGDAYSLQWAYDGEEALAKLRTLTPDVILLDIVMAPMDGVSLAKAIRKQDRLRQVPLIAVTATAAAGEQARAQQFCLVKHSGLRDPELVALLMAALAGVHADYLAIEPTS